MGYRQRANENCHYIKIRERGFVNRNNEDLRAFVRDREDARREYSTLRYSLIPES
jgi:hypothetical protein